MSLNLSTKKVNHLVGSQTKFSSMANEISQGAELMPALPKKEPNPSRLDGFCGDLDEDRLLRDFFSADFLRFLSLELFFVLPEETALANFRGLQLSELDPEESKDPGGGARWLEPSFPGRRSRCSTCPCSFSGEVPGPLGLVG